MIKWPIELIEELARRRCVVFMGSGVSANSTNARGEHPATWRRFLEKGIDKLPKKSQQDEVKKQIRYENYLMACELLRKYFGNDEFLRLLQAEFLDPQYEVANIHKDIFALDARIVITPNFDKIYDTYAATETKGTAMIKNYYDDDLARVLRGNYRMIFKIHGSIDTPDKLIFTHNDYATARSNNANFYLLLNSLLLTHTFLFLGAGLNDPDIKLLLENNANQFKSAQRHYFIIPKKTYSPDLLSIYEDSLKLKFIQYDKSSGHLELLQSINELVTLVNDARTDMANKQSW